MPERITLNDGTVLEGTVLDNGDGRTIFVYLTGLALLEGVLLFSDTTKASRIVAYDRGIEHVYEGYTKLWAVNNEYGNCNLTMRKAEVNA